jgi:hypothetical protein
MIETGDVDAGNQLRDKTLRLFQETYGPDFPDTVVVAERGELAPGRGRLDPDFDPPAI